MQITQLVLKELGKGPELIKYVEDRLGHDRRYAIDSTKIQNELGWKPIHTFETGIYQTIAWYKTNQSWLNAVTKQPDFAPVVVPVTTATVV
jgi:dTDP-glucose 4,6-dehydratase